MRPFGALRTDGAVRRLVLAPGGLAADLAHHRVVKQGGLLAQRGRQKAQPDGRALDAQDVPAHHLQRGEPAQSGVGRAVVVPNRHLQQLLQLLGGDDQPQRILLPLQPLQRLGVVLPAAQRQCAR